MSIQEIVKPLKEGRRVKRISWDPGETIGLDDRGLFWQHKSLDPAGGGSVITAYHFSLNDLLAEDWMILKT